MAFFGKYVVVVDVLLLLLLLLWPRWGTEASKKPWYTRTHTHTRKHKHTRTQKHTHTLWHTHISRFASFPLFHCIRKHLIGRKPPFFFGPAIPSSWSSSSKFLFSTFCFVFKWEVPLVLLLRLMSSLSLWHRDMILDNILAVPVMNNNKQSIPLVDFLIAMIFKKVSK